MPVRRKDGPSSHNPRARYFPSRSQCTQVHLGVAKSGGFMSIGAHNGRRQGIPRSGWRWRNRMPSLLVGRQRGLECRSLTSREKWGATTGGGVGVGMRIIGHIAKGVTGEPYGQNHGHKHE
jgi:hypothetical protein